MIFFFHLPSAEENENHVVEQRDREAKGGHAARLDGRFRAWMDHLNARRFDEKPHDYAQHLNSHKT